VRNTYNIKRNYKTHETTLTPSKTQTRTNNNYVSHTCEAMNTRQHQRYLKHMCEAVYTNKQQVYVIRRV
jgi:hypothetical protein